MSEEKLYAVKNDEGEYWDFGGKTNRFWSLLSVEVPVTDNKEIASAVAKATVGHVVTLVEEPKKVVLTKEQAEIVERAHYYTWPAKYITDHCGNSNGLEELLMNAYVNGYTVAKEKKYLVELDGLVTTDGAKQYLTKKDGKWFACRRMPGMHQDFTDDELKTSPDWAQQLDRVEVTDNGK